MIKTKMLVVITFLLMAHQLISQDELKVKFGDVSVEDLSKKSYEIDSSADAVVLYDKGTIEFVGNNWGGLDFEYVRHCRIHILNNKRFDLASHQVPCFSETAMEEERLSNIEGITYNLVDGKVEKSKMQDEGIFKTKGSRNWTLHKITIPNLKEGRII